MPKQTPPDHLETRPIAIDRIVIQLDPVDGLPINPRGDVQDTTDLQQSISQIGLSTPVLVRPIPERQGFFYLVHGHRRLTAVSRMGQKEVMCNIKKGGDWRTDVLIMLSAESQQEYPALSLARRVVSLHKSGLSYKEIAEAWGKGNADAVSAYAKLLTAPQQVLDAVMSGRMGVTVFASMKNLPAKEQIEILDAHEGEITSRQLKAYRNQRKASKPGFVANAVTLSTEPAMEITALYQRIITTLNEIELSMKNIPLDDWPIQAKYLHEQIIEQMAQIRPSCEPIATQPISPQTAPQWQTFR